MNTKILVLITSVIFFVSTQAQALGFGLEAGFRQQSGDASNSTSVSSQNGFNLGVSGVFQFSSALALKSGLFYIERPLNFVENTFQTEVKTKHTYFDIPLHVMFMLEDYAGIYAGPSISLLLNQKVETVPAVVYTSSSTDKKTMLIPFTIGAHFKFAPQYGLNIFYENISGDVAGSLLKNYRAVGANFIFAMD